MARVAFVLIDPFADWEPALLSTRMDDETFGDAVQWLTPGGKSVRSMGALRVAADGAVEDFDPARFDALVLVGSPTWATPESPDLTPVLQRAADAGLVIGGICGATLALARAGLLDDRPHTSNSLKFLQAYAAGYRGAAHYRDSARAVADGRVVTASGLAPVSFAAEMMRLLHPGDEERIGRLQEMFAREHQAVR